MYLSAAENLNWPCADFVHSYFLYFLLLHNHPRIPQCYKLLRLCKAIGSLAWKVRFDRGFLCAKVDPTSNPEYPGDFPPPSHPNDFTKCCRSPEVITLTAGEYSHIDISSRHCEVIVISRWIPGINVCYYCRCCYFSKWKSINLLSLLMFRSILYSVCNHVCFTRAKNIFSCILSENIVTFYRRTPHQNLALLLITMLLDSHHKSISYVQGKVVSQIENRLNLWTRSPFIHHSGHAFHQIGDDAPITKRLYPSPGVVCKSLLCCLSVK